jgi:hypothetical protein
MNLYRHTQIGYSVLIFTLIVWLFIAVLNIGTPHVAIFMATSVVLLVIAVLFASMTITVTDDRLEWSLTLGLFRQTIARSSIRNVSSVKISLLNGLGIRTNNFRDYLWSVGGSEAIRLEMDNGRVLMLSTDDCDALLRVLEIAP